MFDLLIDLLRISCVRLCLSYKSYVLVHKVYNRSHTFDLLKNCVCKWPTENVYTVSAIVYQYYICAWIFSIQSSFIIPLMIMSSDSYDISMKSILHFIDYSESPPSLKDHSSKYDISMISILHLIDYFESPSYSNTNPQNITPARKLNTTMLTWLY